jgi:hypothetical protein
MKGQGDEGLYQLLSQNRLVRRFHILTTAEGCRYRGIMDQKHFQAGKLPEEIERQIKDSDVLLVLTYNFYKSNWNRYLLRFGSSVVSYDCWDRQEAGKQDLERQLKQVPPQCRREVRKEIRCNHSKQLKRFRFLHRCQTYLASLE